MFLLNLLGWCFFVWLGIMVLIDYFQPTFFTEFFSPWYQFVQIYFYLQIVLFRFFSYHLSIGIKIIYYFYIIYNVNIEFVFTYVWYLYINYTQVVCISYYNSACSVISTYIVLINNGLLHYDREERQKRHIRDAILKTDTI